VWLEQHLDIFFGRSTEVVTDVYLRAPRQTPWSGPVRLAGRITGPYCQGIRTVPSPVVFEDLGEGPTLLARACVPDLAPWSPLHPHVYRVEVQLLLDNHPVDQVRRVWGCHRLGVHQSWLFQGGKRYPLLAARLSDPLGDAQLWHDLAVAAVVESPQERWLAEATTWGTPTVCVAAPGDTTLVERLRYWARFPAVWLALLADRDQTTEELNNVAPNLLLATWWNGVPPRPPVVITCLWEHEYPTAKDQLQGVPVFLVRRRYPANASDEEAAQQVRQWADTQPGPFAGYIVW